MKISRELDIPRQSISRITKSYLETGSICPKTRGGDKKSILSPDDKLLICGWVDENCTLTLNELKIKLNATTGQDVSISTIDRSLKQYHYSLKRISVVPERRNCSNTLAIREKYARDFRYLEEDIADDNLIFVDEVGLSVSSQTSRGRFLIGTRANMQVPAVRTKKHFCFCSNEQIRNDFASNF